ncbi:MAG: C39 family peptidase [Mangrovibacterium sp.]
MPANRISEELLASFMEGNTSPQETETINHLLATDPDAFAEFLLAFKASCFSDEEQVEDTDPREDPVIGHPHWNIAAGFAAAISGLAGFAGSVSPMAHVAPLLGNDDNFGDADDRSSGDEGSITENSNRSMMGALDHPENFNPIQQQYDDTCAIKSQQLILNDFGIPVTEDQLVQQAEQFHIYTPGSGTSPEDVGKLLVQNGVPCTQYENATVYDLTSALAQGQKVIIGVDSDELWDKGLLSQYGNKITDYFGGESADHALIVAGIDTTDPDHVQVILTDPGTGEEAARYPMEQFLDAWHDSGNFMVTTDSPAPLAYNPEMINFDYDAGHIPAIGQMPYDYFDQTVMPIVQNMPVDTPYHDLLWNNFSGMVGGDLSGFSHDFIDVINQTPFAGMLDLHVDELSFGSRRMADYYNDWAEHHEQLAQYDIEHGNLDSAQNHLRYVDDCHDHAMDELDDDIDD